MSSTDVFILGNATSTSNETVTLDCCSGGMPSFRGWEISIIIDKEQLMEWNALRTSNIYVGQRLKIKTGESKPVIQTQPEVKPEPEPVKKYYSVKSGDTFAKIADRNGLTQTQLSRLNPGVNVNRLSVGQQIRIK